MLQFATDSGIYQPRNSFINIMNGILRPILSYIRIKIIILKKYSSEYSRKSFINVFESIVIQESMLSK